MLTLLAVACSLATMAQMPDSPAYKKNPTVPSFSLVRVDSSSFASSGLKHQPTLIMYFSPTCDHCKHQWDDMVKHKKELENIQIVMATYESFEEMEQFHKDQKIGDYPNITMGRDEKFTLPPFYRMRTLPYQALYDRNGKLITTFEGNIAIEKLLEAFSNK